MLAWLWTRFKLSTWLLAVSAFSLEVVVKIVCTLSIYALFVVDSRRNTYWENLDDYVYYIKAVGNGIEFVFGVFLFLNGAWILLFESGGAIR
jgi:E3 ubiquitin-protein ligase RNF139